MRFLNNNRYSLRVLIISYIASSFLPRARITYIFAIKSHWMPSLNLEHITKFKLLIVHLELAIS